MNKEKEIINFESVSKYMDILDKTIYNEGNGFNNKESSRKKSK